MGDSRIDRIHPAPRVGVPHEAWRRDEPEPQREGDGVLAEGTGGVSKLMIETGSSFELFCAAIAVVLAVIGLAGYLPMYVAAIATIAAGLALLAQGSTIAARWREAMRIAGRERTDRIGMSIEMFGGLLGITLGLLALVGVASVPLLAVATLVLGLALLLGGPAQPEIVEDPPSSPRRWHVTRDIARASGGLMVMGGLAAAVLAVLALANAGPALPLTLIGLVCIAVALMLAGGSLFARFRKKLA